MMIFGQQTIDEEVAATEKHIAELERKIIVFKGYILHLKDEFQVEANISPSGVLTHSPQVE